MAPASWRDCQAWRDEGLTLSSSSNEACKLYDAILTQYVKWKNDESMGGIEGCISAIQAADPNFVMGHMISTGLELMGTSSSACLNERLAGAVRRTVELANAQDITYREKLHVRAIELFSRGDFPKAADVWEEILLDHPTDMTALKFAHDAYFYMGAQLPMRDSVIRVLPHWKPHIPLYRYLNGMLSFGLLETRLYDQAEKAAMAVRFASRLLMHTNVLRHAAGAHSRKDSGTFQGLALTPDDAWATHSMAHVYEMRSEADKSLSFFERTEKDWQNADILASHNYWHWALNFIEKGQYEAALEIFDSQVFRFCKSSGSMLDIVDACSLLYRLEMEGVSVKDRWRELLQVTQPHSDDHVTLFNDLHFLMVSLGAKDSGTSRRLLEGLQELSKEPGNNHQHQLAGTVGVPMCQAMMEYDQGNHDRAFELLYPLRYKIVGIGGSDAQRDLFSQLMVHAAMKSEKTRNQKLGRCLLMERDTVRPDSPLTQRLMRKALVLHN